MTTEKYDYLIVGCGLYGSVFAYHKHLQGKSCLIIDKREHIGGNVYTKNDINIDIHKYGPHIFNTSNKEIWDFVNKFCDMTCFQYSPKANHKGKLYSLPFNLNTILEVYNIDTPQEAKKFLASKVIKIENPSNLEEVALSQIGPELYEMFVYGYTKKQWGKDPKELPSSIIKRIPVRFNFNNSYYNKKYQGIPNNGYTEIVLNLTKNIEIKTSTEFDKQNWNHLANKLVFTGPIDEFFNYKFGNLEYRSLRFEEKILDTEDFQGSPAINYTDVNVPYTRIVEHKHFNPHKQSDKTIITYEFPETHEQGKNQPYYPVNTANNQSKYENYKKEADKNENLLISGRLGLFRYLNMDQVIAIAIKDSQKF